MKKQPLPWICLALSLMLNVWLFSLYSMHKLHLSLEHGHIKFMEQCSQDIYSRDEKGKIELKEYVQNYYRSDTKQVADSKLNDIVEIVRKLIVEDMEQVIAQEKASHE